MEEDEQKKEVVVKAPPNDVTPSEKKAERSVEKALEKERFSVLKFSRRVGMYFGASMLAAGVLLICVFGYFTLVGYEGWVTAPPEIVFLGFAIWIFVGIVSSVGGLLLMGTE